MGSCVYDPETPVVKGTNAILAFNKYSQPTVTNCIRCGRCIRACPFMLMPAEMEKAYRKRDIETLKALKVTLLHEPAAAVHTSVRQDASLQKQISSLRRSFQEIDRKEDSNVEYIKNLPSASCKRQYVYSESYAVRYSGAYAVGYFCRLLFRSEGDNAYCIMYTVLCFI